MQLSAQKHRFSNGLLLAGFLFSAGFSNLLAWEISTEDSPSPTIKTASAAEERLLKDIQFLSSDTLQGRAAETPGLKMGAEYIASRWEALGLKTDLFDGKPFQEFTLEGTPGLKDPLKNLLSITKPNGETISLQLGEQFQPQSIGSNGEFSGALVFAGYGITAEEDNLKYDDFEGLDVKGKVVIVIRKEPQITDPKSPFDGEAPSQYALFTAKQMNAAKHGVAALIMINDPASDAVAPDTVLPVAGSGTAMSKDQVPTLFLQRSLVESWMAEAGSSLSQLEKEIDQDLKPRSRELTGWKVTGQVDVSNKTLPSMNVLGLLPGKGSLENEMVVVGAHFDHVGMGGPGSLAPGTIAVHNGADDNASGTVALMETARRLVELSNAAPPDQPRRSVLFIAFSGEERGLLGSEHYVNYPRFELANTVAMLNLDMVGRLTNNALTVYGTGTAQEFDAMLTKANETLAFDLQKSPEGMGPSDHQSFFQKNIPVLHFFTGLHDDYHRPSDDFDKINLSGLSRITDMVIELADGILTNPAKPSFVKVKGRANPQASGPKRIRLGVRLKTNADGIVVERVLSEGIAKRAGMEPGDLLLKINEDETKSRPVLDRILQTHKTGETIVLHVQRGEEKIELKVELTD